MGNIFNKRWKIYGFDSSKRKVRIHVIGDESTGKTQLIKTFLDVEESVEEIQQESAMLRFQMNHKELENGKIQLTIYDCKSDTNVNNKQLAVSDGAIICFSLNDPESFEKIKDFWIPEIRKSFPRLPLLLVGTKRDLRDNARKIAHFVREVQGRLLAHKHKLKGYIECSSETGDNVEKVFNTFITR